MKDEKPCLIGGRNDDLLGLRKLARAGPDAASEPLPEGHMHRQKEVRLLR